MPDVREVITKFLSTRDWRPDDPGEDLTYEEEVDLIIEALKAAGFVIVPTPNVTHEGWLIASAAWNNVPLEEWAETCAKNDTRMPSGSREAWGRVFAAIRSELESENAALAARVEALILRLNVAVAMAGALKIIAELKSEPIADTGFATGPQSLLNICQRTARAALKVWKEPTDAN